MNQRDTRERSIQTFAPGPTPGTVRAADGKVLAVPKGWILLPPGDAGLTRRVKAAGDHWIVQEKRGRRVFSQGLWAAATTIHRIRAELDAERSTEAYTRRKASAARSREKAQTEYVEDFFDAVVSFLAFHPSHKTLADASGASRGRSCHARRKWDGRADKTDPGRAAGRGRSHCLDASPDNRLRLDAHSTGQRQPTGSSASACPAFQRIAGPLSSRRNDRWHVPPATGSGRRGITAHRRFARLSVFGRLRLGGFLFRSSSASSASSFTHSAMPRVFDSPLDPSARDVYEKQPI